MSEPTNADRAQWGIDALDHPPHNENKEPELRMVDLLTNLLHAGDALELDVDELMQQAHIHYNYELNHQEEIPLVPHVLRRETFMTERSDTISIPLTVCPDYHTAIEQAQQRQTLSDMGWQLVVYEGDFTETGTNIVACASFDDEGEVELTEFPERRTKKE